MKKKKRKKIKLHLKWKSFFIFLVVLGFIIGILFYIYRLHVKNIYIDGNHFLSDYEIVVAAGIKDYPKMITLRKTTMEKQIKSLDLVEDVSVKRNLLGKVTIKIDEAIPLFYNRDQSIYVLSNGKKTNEYPFTGVPFLVNYVPENIYNRLIKELGNVELSSLEMASEIEYQPSKSGETVIDDTRFLFRMNDGNQVYINLINIDRLDSYPLIYTILTEKGVLELDSDNGRVVFKSYKSIEENKQKEDGESE